METASTPKPPRAPRRRLASCEGPSLAERPVDRNGLPQVIAGDNSRILARSVSKSLL
jgi:hypothetical protein